MTDQDMKNTALRKIETDAKTNPVLPNRPSDNEPVHRKFGASHYGEHKVFGKHLSTKVGGSKLHFNLDGSWNIIESDGKTRNFKADPKVLAVIALLRKDQPKEIDKTADDELHYKTILKKPPSNTGINYKMPAEKVYDWLYGGKANRLKSEALSAKYRKDTGFISRQPVESVPKGSDKNIYWRTIASNKNHPGLEGYFSPVETPRISIVDDTPNQPVSLKEMGDIAHEQYHNLRNDNNSPLFKSMRYWTQNKVVRNTPKGPVAGNWAISKSNPAILKQTLALQKLFKRDKYGRSDKDYFLYDPMERDERARKLKALAARNGLFPDSDENAVKIMDEYLGSDKSLPEGFSDLGYVKALYQSLKPMKYTRMDSDRLNDVIKLPADSFKTDIIESKSRAFLENPIIRQMPSQQTYNLSKNLEILEKWKGAPPSVIRSKVIQALRKRVKDLQDWFDKVTPARVKARMRNQGKLKEFQKIMIPIIRGTDNRRINPLVKQASDVKEVVDKASVVEGQKVDFDPSKALIDSGGYRKGHLKLDGLDVTIENPKGSVRRGTDPNGDEWAVDIKADYGYVKGTEGYDKDHLDVIIVPGTKHLKTIYVVNQKTGKGGFDEHKCVLGAADAKEAERVYKGNYEDGWDGILDIVPLTLQEFKKWAFNGGPAKGRLRKES